MGKRERGYLKGRRCGPSLPLPINVTMPVQYINSYGQDKVIFGTDFPVLDFGRTVAEIDGLGLREVPRRKLMRDNALAVYGLEG